MTRLLDEVVVPRVVSADEVFSRVRDWQGAGLTVAAIVGAFDLLHEGHLALLTVANETADRLVVGVRDDQWVEAERGVTRPVHPATERAEVLAGLKPIDLVVVLDRQAGANWIGDLRPDVLVLSEGDPADGGAEILLPAGTRVVYVPVVPGASTTALIGRIRGEGVAGDNNAR